MSAIGRSRPLRIVYVTASLDLGGSERQMINLATRLPLDRFRPEFVLLTGRGALADQVEQAGIPVHELRWHRGEVPLRRVRRLADVARYIGQMRRGRYDIVDGWLYHAYALAAATRDVVGAPVVIAGRRSLSDFKSDFNRINRALDGLARRRVDAIVANGDGVRRDVAERENLPLSRIDVIRNGISPAVPMDDETRARLRSSWRLGPQDVVVGVVANYKAGKGLEDIIEMAGRAGVEDSRLAFVLVGEGDQRALLESMITARGLSERIVLFGSVVDARALYGAFDIGLQASRSEGLPNAVLEAAAAGLPVVATDTGATSEIVIDGETGYVVPVGSEPPMLAKLRDLARSRKLRERLGTAAQRRTMEVFGMDRFVAESAALYERVWAARGKRR